MKTLGLTGGIGSGKSTVAQLFEKKGVPVFNSDKEAKLLYTDSETVKAQVVDLLGPESYENDELNRKWVSQKVFENQELLKQLNQIIHPAVQHKFEDWKALQNAEFVVKEAAILFESGAYKQCNAVFTVTADEEIRMKRVMQRDGLSQEQISKRMAQQWPDRRKVELSDFSLVNNGSLEDLEKGFEALFPDIQFRLS